MSSDQASLLKLGDIAKVKGGKRMPAGTALIASRTSHPYLRIVDFKDGSIDQKNLQYVPDEVFPAISRYVIKSTDLYISIVGTIGLVGVVPEELDGANLTENAAKICEIDCSVIDRDYLGYYLRSDMGQAEIKSLSVGSTQPKLALFRIEQINIPCPPLNAQRAISSMLGALDDRISLLRETNATLEAIAQALFKSWFVDFDPVHANAHARAQHQNSHPQAVQQNPAPQSAEAYTQNLGLDAATAALFPDHFQDSDLGPIPAGWSVSTVGEAVNVTDYVANGSFASLKENVTLLDDPAYALYVRTTDYNSGFSGGFRYVDQRAYEFLSKSCLEGDEVIISNVGDVGTVFRPPRWLGMRMTLGSNAVALKAPQMSYYLYLYFSGAKGQHDIASIVTGSAQLKFNKTNFRSLKILIPSQEVLKNFESISSGIFSSWDMNRAKIQTLTQLRDTLLPRLISGQLRLPDAEAQIEAVVGGA